ncbi:hybrid sensor histidine kinase/response regulator [Mesoterricola sediminis]|uniref:histidine kinase n=1 Tax=Mesoterricola sediminis TaxID=2927980 RepID=A0AA48GUS8_9BACT|nr:hybrid sensor histidine kinase/response regulator [Mesoterricola sediminis]BDU78174.1 hybrid sensor histidine kinase/response regulator [Mesoterricola sediminis]
MLVPPADILLIDDNPANLELLTVVLKVDGHRIRTVTSGPMGLEAARRHLPELVLLDVTMPGMDGYETCEAMRADEVLRGVPVIFISALDDPLDKVKAFQCGGRDYITKPFSIEEVKARVEHHVTLARLGRDLERQNQALLDANLKLKEIHTLKANFTAMLVHDIRSPLTSVGLVLGMVKEGSRVGPGAMAQAEESFERVNRLLEEMLELHRSEHQGLPVDRADFEAGAWLEAVAERFRFRAERLDLAFQASLHPGMPVLHGDRAKLDRALDNLLDNALKFTPRGGAVKLETGLEYGAGVEAGLTFLRIDVIDTGRGIPAEELPFIFDPFRQVKGEDAPKGFGLGLAITQRIVASHQGQIHAQSQVGFGSCFRMLLPV